jgi:hypothetical protein
VNGEGNGDDPGEIETGDVIKREPRDDLEGDPGEIELVELREGEDEATGGAGSGWIDRSREWGGASEPEPDPPDPDPGPIELEDIVGETGEREVGA